MSSIATIRDAWRRSLRLWRSRLRRDRAAGALLLLLLLGPGESLLCIFHCQVWLPIAVHDYLMAQHHHHHHMQPALDVTASFALPGTAAPAAPICLIHLGAGGASEAPFHVPPSPIHEMILAGLPALILLLLKVGAPAPPSLPLVSVYVPPPLRPPIPLPA